MVKVIIQMDGEQDKVLSGEFANVMTASDVGVRYKAHKGVIGAGNCYERGDAQWQLRH